MKITFGGDNRNPLWSPDGEHVIFTENVAADWRIVRTASDGSQLEPELLFSIERGIPGFPLASTISPDGRSILFYYGGLAASDILEVELGHPLSSRRQNTLLGSRFDEFQPRIAPDGGMLAYVSDRSGRDEVWLRSFPNVEATAPIQVSKNGGARPVWSTDGHNLYYVEDRRIVSVSVTGGHRPSIGTARLVTDDVDFDAFGAVSFDVTPDGSVVVVRSNTADDGNRIVVVDGWFEELKRLERASR